MGTPYRKIVPNETVDVTNGPPDVLNVTAGTDVTFVSQRDFSIKLDRKKGVKKILVGNASHDPTTKKLGPTQSLTLALEPADRVEVLGYKFNDGDPVIIIDPN